MFGLGLALFVLTIVFLRDIRVLERYRYTIAIAGILLLLAPRVPGIGEQVNGAYLSVGIGPISVPARRVREDRDRHLPGELPERHARRARGRAGLPRLSIKHLGPLLVVFGLAMLMLVFIRDLGSSLMFFGAFLALLYVATNRVSLVVSRRCSRSWARRTSSARASRT